MKDNTRMEEALNKEISRLNEKIAELEKKRSERERFNDLYRASINENGIGFAVTDMNGVFLDANECFRKTVGYTDHELKSMTYEDLTPEGWRTAEKEMVSECNMTGAQSRVYEKEYRRKDGSIFPVELQAFIIKDGNGEPSNMWALVRDITEKKRSEDRLRESEAKYGGYMRNAPDGVFVFDEKGRFLEVNRAACRMTGHTEEELLRMYIPDLVADESLNTAMADFEKLIETGTSSGEYQCRRKDGSIRWSLVDAARLSQTRYIGFMKDVTGRRQAEAVLRKSEDKYRTLVENLTEGVWVIDKDSFTTFVNSHMAEMLGYTVDEMMGKHLFSFMDQRGIEIATGEIERRKTGVKAQHAFEFIKKDGSRIHTTLKTSAITDPDGIYAGAIAGIQDVTDRKLAEEALRESRRQLMDIIEFLPDATVVINRGGKVIAWNRAMEEMTGIGKEKMIGQGHYAYALPFYGSRQPHLLDLLDLADEELAAKYKSVRRVGNTLYAEVFTPALYKGKGAHILAAASPLFDSSGMRTGAIESIRDISDRKEIEDKYRKIFDNAVIGISQSTSEGRYVTVNSSFARMFGYDSPDDLVHSIHDIAEQTYARPEERLDYLRRLREEGFVDGYELERIRKDGSRVWVSITSRIVRDAAGDISLIETFIKDISELKLLEQQLFQAQKMESIGILAGGIAHDFNNILATIIGYTEIALYRELGPDHPARSGLGQVLVACDRAKDLIAQILTFSRQREGSKSPIDVRPIVKETLKLLRSSLPSTIEINENLTAKKAVILGDPVGIHQALMNLCTNAAHAMREKGGVLTVLLEDASFDEKEKPPHSDLGSGSYLRLRVADTGHGITPEHLTHIFDPFFTTKRLGEGTGLGLSVVHGIVRNHGGAVLVQSIADKGASFDIFLPKSESAAGETRVERKKTLPAEGREKILFVDDEEPIVKAGVRLLSHLGYEVTGMSSSIEALDLVRRQPAAFDLVITDQTMPGMTGAEMAGEIRRIRPGIPIFLCTGYSEVMTPEKTAGIGINALLMKPIPIYDLSRTIRDALDGEAQRLRNPRG